jgi:hypothetical protein
MKNKWILYGTTAVLLLAGCQKSSDTADQTAANATDSSAAGSASGRQQTRAKEKLGPIVVPEGTSISVILSSSLSSKVNKPGEEFEASLAEPVLVNGVDAIPKGAKARGVVADAKKQGAFAGAAGLAVRLTSVHVHGKDYEIETSTYSAAQKGKGKRTAVVTGGGAAVGALIGGLAGGGKGAAIGAAAGGGGGLAASGATGGKNVEFPVESRLMFKLTQPLTIER